MKKLISILLLGIFVSGLLVGCSSSSSDKKNGAATSIKESKKENVNSFNKTNAQNGKKGKTLIVYYSATGNTKKVAKEIAKKTNGVLFELQPAKKYTTEDLDYNNPKSRVCKEHDHVNLQDVKLSETTVKDFKKAKVVILGYPIWWGKAAWPVNNFVKNNDFTGKTVIPFCTSASSEIGDSGKKLSQMAGTGKWQEGKRFSSDASEEEIQDWIKSLNLEWN